MNENLNDDLDAAAAELRAARRELELSLLVAAEYLRAQSQAGDSLASVVVGLVDTAHDRLVAANIAGTTALETGG